MKIKKIIAATILIVFLMACVAAVLGVIVSAFMHSLGTGMVMSAIIGTPVLLIWCASVLSRD